MKKHRKDKDFLHLPTYPGGKKAYQEFIRMNLRYPDEALAAKVEGRVNLSFEVNDNGDVFNIQVMNSLGYGCDEEAVRLVSLLKYDKVKNRGVRVKSTIKTAIEFRINPAPAGMNYQYVITPTPPKKEEPPKKDSGGEVYGYTISF
jgi:protein TonB